MTDRPLYCPSSHAPAVTEISPMSLNRDIISKLRNFMHCTSSACSAIEQPSHYPARFLKYESDTSQKASQIHTLWTAATRGGGSYWIEIVLEQVLVLFQPEHIASIRSRNIFCFGTRPCEAFSLDI